MLTALFLALQLGAKITVAQNVERAEPKVEGKDFKMPDWKDRERTREEVEKMYSKPKKSPVPPVSTKKPGTRQRGYDLENRCGKKGYSGRCKVYQFTNDDFPVTGITCGQAAAVTALWNAGLKDKYRTPALLAKSFYNIAPPKTTIAGVVNLGGSLGTDWRQLDRGLSGYKSQGIKHGWYKGEAELKKYLSMQLPCIIMLDIGPLRAYNYAWGRGHWVVGYGWDNNGIYVTNHPETMLSWDDLRKGWGGVWNEGHLAKAHGTAEMFAAVWK